MFKSKPFICFIIGLLILIISAEIYRSHRDSMRQIWAQRYFVAGVQESQNCLRKLAGGRSSLKNDEAVLKPHLKECRLQYALVEMPDVVQEACIGLAQATFSEQGGMRLRRILRDNQPIREDKCASLNQITMDFETTQSGLDWYEKMLTVVRDRVAEETPAQPETLEPTLEQMVERNAFPKEIVSELKRTKEQPAKSTSNPAKSQPKPTDSQRKHKAR